MGVLHIAWRYLAHNRVKTTILVASIALLVFVPVGLRVLVGHSAAQLTARADVTPLVIGSKGSPLELVLRSLYFEGATPGTMRFEQVERVVASGLAQAIPIHARFHARGTPIVGTSVDYLEHRGLSLAAGRPMAVLGDCVLGADVARERGLGVGDSVISSPESVFDLAGVYPLKMTIVGVLAPSFTPDDRSVFVDIKTTWVMEGLCHGHEDLSRPEASSGVLEREGELITANASVVQYTEITPDTLDAFHFHGDPAGFPVTAIIAMPRDAKASALLQGRYQAPDDPVQLVRPREVIDELLGTVFTVQGYVIAAVVFVGGATLATTALVFLLSLRLRRREFQTLARIGAPRGAVRALMFTEVALVVLLGLALAGLLTVLSSRYAPELVRSLVLS